MRRLEYKLLPCPLCCGKAEHTVSIEHGNQNTVKCKDCGCRVSSQFNTCVDKWNTRAGNTGSILEASVVDLVNEQAEDEGLWFVAETVTEAYLMRNLRELHSAIENACEDCGENFTPHKLIPAARFCEACCRDA